MAEKCRGLPEITGFLHRTKRKTDSKTALFQEYSFFLKKQIENIKK